MSFFERIDRFDGPQRSQLRVVPVGAAPGGECYLLFVGGSTLLVDSGFQFCGPQLVEHLRRTLQGRALDYILLTHSHYDHALGSVFCKQAWPEATVVASRYAAGIFQKPHARALMRRLDAYQAAQCGVTGAPDCIDALRVDLPVEDGDQIPLDGDTIRIIALPGHTRCCIGFYLETHQILLAPETLGVPIPSGTVMPAYLVGYQMTLNAIAKAAQLPLRELLVSHAGMLYGPDCAAFLQRSAACCRQGRDLILGAYHPGVTMDELIAVFRRAFYPSDCPGLYPEMAFQTNVRVQIPLLLQECGGIDPAGLQ